MPDETEEAQASSDETSATPTTPSVSRTPWRPEPTWQRWTAPVALLIAVVAVALSIWALMSASSKTSGAAAKLPGDPKTRVCTAFDTVTKGVTLQTYANLGSDPVAQQAVAANARLSLAAGGQYLLNQLDSATPSGLADAVRSFANNLQEVAVSLMAGVPNTDPEQAKLMTQADLTRQQIVNMCK